ncbi:MAG: hypothetical protein U0S49_04830 [Rhodospirillales bacterium]|nr:hypothetical protein [Rhodospirillales bacterium]
MKTTLAAALTALALAGCAGTATPEAKPPAPLLDLSGLAWLGGDRFLAVHDAKTPKEGDLPRVSILTLPVSLDGVQRIDATPKFPEAPSSDLEAVAAIPGTDKLLLAESGDDAGPFDRIFLAQVRGDAVEILDAVRWRDFTDYFNVEAMAVAAAGGGSPILLWAERNSGKDRTLLRWARLGVEPLRVEGPVGSVSFVLPASARDGAGQPLFNRAIVALDVDRDGGIYAASTLDPEGTSADPDNGPFRSIVYRIGRIGGGGPELQAKPEVLAVLDGLKVESLAVREEGGQRQLFVGTDDENHGGILRPLPAPRR